MKSGAGNRRGFTLVEVIVVLVVLAILAAIIIPAMTGWIESANEKKLVVGCRTCVTAAQTLASEQYGLSGTIVAPDAGEVLLLADVPGAVSGIAVDAKTAAVDQLTYDDGTDSVTYYRLPTPHYDFSKGGALTPGWASGTGYAIGDRISAGDMIFECTRAHTSGTTSNTRSPGEKANKSTWKVVGTKTGAETPAYGSIYRYAEGVTVTYGGKTYRRTNYELGADQAPYAGSPYWDVVE